LLLRSCIPAVRLAILLVAASHLAAGCRTKTPSFGDPPPAEDLYAEGLKILEGRRIAFVYTWIDYTAAIETFQAIIDNYPYSSYAVRAELRIADTYFDDGRYEEALSYYRDFGDLHPGHEKVPYSLLRSALCYYRQVKSVDRDQTASKEALVYLEQLIRSHPYAPETQEGETILLDLRRRLSRNMMTTADFYLKRGEYQAAAARYRRVLDQFPGLDLDAEGLYKLGICYEHMKRVDEALRIYHVILENYRDTRIASAAAERIAAGN
jgi:outer membrane protein assembly factor BamD